MRSRKLTLRQPVASNMKNLVTDISYQCDEPDISEISLQETSNEVSLLKTNKFESINSEFNFQYQPVEVNLEVIREGKKEVAYDKLHNIYVPGKIVFGTDDAVATLLDAKLVDGTHAGVIKESRLKPSADGRYTQGEQYDASMLDSGSFGKVYKCRHVSNFGYVKKTIPKDKFSRLEVDILNQLTHVNITECYGYINRGFEHDILLEYGGVSLKTFVSTHRHDIREILTDVVIAEIALQGFRGLAYIHDKNILNQDVKPENLLIQMYPLLLKITDFGTSTFLKQEPCSLENGWTPEYMPPEACRIFLAPCCDDPSEWMTILTGKVDVFAMTLSMIYAVTGEHAVRSLQTPDMTPDMLPMWRAIFVKHLADNPDCMKTVAVKHEWSNEMWKLFTGGLEGDPNDRMSAAEACAYIEQNMKYVTMPAPTNAVVLHVSRPTSGNPQSIGKTIKERLAQKIRKSQGIPYHLREDPIVPTQPSDQQNVDVQNLPNFDMLV